MIAYTQNMHQDAVYWPPLANDGFGGVGYGDPVAIKCRWQDKADLFRDAQGQEAVSSAIVYPDRALAVKGKIALGTIEGSDVSIALEIRNAGTSPSLDAGRVLHKVWL